MVIQILKDKKDKIDKTTKMETIFRSLESIKFCGTLLFYIMKQTNISKQYANEKGSLCCWKITAAKDPDLHKDLFEQFVH